MKNIRISQIIYLVATLVIGAIIGWAIKSSNVENDKNLHSHELEETLNQVYTCSMHPQIRQNEPGSCPLCGMALIPVDGGSGDDEPLSISMSDNAMQLANVQTAIVGGSTISRTIMLNGKVKTDERMLFTQSSHIPGRIEKLEINFTGEYVKAGQRIATVYSPELTNAQQELFEAQKLVGTQPALLEAAKQKLKNWKLTDSQIEKIIQSGTTVSQFPITANVSGYVTQKLVNLGDYVSLGQPMYEISDLSRVWVQFEVYEADLLQIQLGNPIEYTMRSIPGEKFTGKISYIDPVIDPNTRVALARVEAKNTDMKLKPEMFAVGQLSTDTKTATQLTVPKSAVLWTGKRSLVYVKNSNTTSIRFTMREVTLGAEMGNSYLITAGLNAGEEIAVNGTFSIDAAAQLAGKPSMMNGMMDNNMNVESAVVPTKMLHNNEALSTALKPIFEAYLSLSTTLANDDFTSSITFINSLKKNIESFNKNKVKGSEAESTFIKSLLTPVIEQLVVAKDIEQIRSAFLQTSNAMVNIADQFHPIDEPLYVQYCPMADSNKGANWLSLDKKITNPYFGSSMLSCGETKRIISN